MIAPWSTVIFFAMRWLYPKWTVRAIAACAAVHGA